MLYHVALRADANDAAHEVDPLPWNAEFTAVAMTACGHEMAGRGQSSNAAAVDRASACSIRKHAVRGMRKLR
jgi:hypothetical protein